MRRFARLCAAIGILHRSSGSSPLGSAGRKRDDSQANEGSAGQRTYRVSGRGAALGLRRSGALVCIQCDAGSELDCCCGRGGTRFRESRSASVDGVMGKFVKVAATDEIAEQPVKCVQRQLDEARRAEELAPVINAKESADFTADELLGRVSHRAFCLAFAQRAFADSEGFSSHQGTLVAPVDGSIGRKRAQAGHGVAGLRGNQRERCLGASASNPRRLAGRHDRSRSVPPEPSRRS